LRDIINLNLELVYGARRPHDKSGVGYVKDSFLSNSKPKKSLTSKEKQPKNIFVKNIKHRMDRNDKPNNHVYQYRYTNKKIPRLPIDQRVIIRYTIGVLMVSLMRLKIKKFQKIEKSKVVSQQSKKVPTNMI
jgi:hypothetical protein